MCIRPGGEEVLSPGRRVTDVWVSNAHCKKVVFTFLPFTFLPFSISFSYAHSQYPLQVLFSIREGEGHFLLIVFFRRILIQKTSIIATLMLYRCVF